MDDHSGSIDIEKNDKTVIENRAKGRLNYVGESYLKFEETGKYFIKLIVDAPENLLAYDDIDATPNVLNLQKKWVPHARYYNIDASEFI